MLCYGGSVFDEGCSNNPILHQPSGFVFILAEVRLILISEVSATSVYQRC